MIIYGLNSPHVAKIRAVLDLKSVKYESVSVDLKNKSEEFLQVSKTGKIPAIDDNGIQIYDSWKIIEYINEKYPQNDILPKSLQEKIIVYNMTTLVDNIFDSLREVYMKKFGLIELSQQREDEILNQVKQKIWMISQELWEKEFLVWDSLSIWDIYISILWVVTTTKLDIESEISDWSEKFVNKYIPNAFPKSDEKVIKNI